MGRKTKGETIGKPLGNHRESGGDHLGKQWNTEGQFEWKAHENTEYKEILKESAENWKKTKGGTIGKPKGGT